MNHAEAYSRFEKTQSEADEELAQLRAELAAGEQDLEDCQYLTARRRIEDAKHALSVGEKAWRERLAEAQSLVLANIPPVIDRLRDELNAKRKELAEITPEHYSDADCQEAKRRDQLLLDGIHRLKKIKLQGDAERKAKGVVERSYRLADR